MDQNGNKRMAVLVGCNYPNTPNELHGCINDVVAMREMLVKRFGFDEDHIQVLTDAPAPGLLQRDDHMMMPTGGNIKKALDQMVDKCESGDVLFFHYSGHGTTIPNSGLFPFRHDEAIVPCDFNLITDMDFRQLVNRVPKGASLTIISDSCHSGGLINKEKEQIGPNSSLPADYSKTKTAAMSYKSKSIPYEYILQHLKSLTGINTSDIGIHLLQWFGGDASLKFRIPSIEIDPFEISLKEDQGILLSGCQANETSADMNPSGGGKACGAFSNAVEMVLKENVNSGALLSNKQVVFMARKFLEDNGIHQQHPCLYCSDHNADALFLCQGPSP